MPTTVIDTVPVTNFSNGTVSRGTRQVPANFQALIVALNCTTGSINTPFTGFTDPFNSASQSMTFGIRWSWDGGVTFPASTEGIQNGSPTGSWGTDKQGNPVMTPQVGLGKPSLNGVAPDHYQGYASVAGGPISTGLTFSEVTS